MFSDPEKNIKQFSVGEDWRLADFGTGSGAYALAAGEMITEGQVYAIDVNPRLLSRLETDAREKRIYSVKTLSGDIERAGGVPLADGSMDGVIAANVFFQVDNKEGLVKEIRRVMRKKGRVLVVDWSGSHGGIGPHGNHVVSKERVEKLFEENGFLFEQTIDAGAHHYGVIFKKEEM
ncbi:MAG: class I SAM-dependent methyltransferase [Candidatus Paceibacterota bacterium]